MDNKESDTYNPFKILKDHFRSQLVKYLEGIGTTMNLVMEESLIPIVTNLLTPVPNSV
jgi:hypothetical protein